MSLQRLQRVLEARYGQDGMEKLASWGARTPLEKLYIGSHTAIGGGLGAALGALQGIRLANRLGVNETAAKLIGALLGGYGAGALTNALSTGTVEAANSSAKIKKYEEADQEKIAGWKAPIQALKALPWTSKALLGAGTAGTTAAGSYIGNLIGNHTGKINGFDKGFNAGTGIGYEDGRFDGLQKAREAFQKVTSNGRVWDANRRFNTTIFNEQKQETLEEAVKNYQAEGADMQKMRDRYLNKEAKEYTPQEVANAQSTAKGMLYAIPGMVAGGSLGRLALAIAMKKPSLVRKLGIYAKDSGLLDSGFFHREASKLTAQNIHNALKTTSEVAGAIPGAAVGIAASYQ